LSLFREYLINGSKPIRLPALIGLFLDWVMTMPMQALTVFHVIHKQDMKKASHTLMNGIRANLGLEGNTVSLCSDSETMVTPASLVIVAAINT
jgi:hypothetical protein